jgi:hypothetical protein
MQLRPGHGDDLKTGGRQQRARSERLQTVRSESKSVVHGAAVTRPLISGRAGHGMLLLIGDEGTGFGKAR